MSYNILSPLSASHVTRHQVDVSCAKKKVDSSTAHSEVPKPRFSTHWESSSQTVLCTPNCGSIALLTTTKEDCHLIIHQFLSQTPVHSLRHTLRTDIIRFGALASGIGSAPTLMDTVYLAAKWRMPILATWQVAPTCLPPVPTTTLPPRPSTQRQWSPCVPRRAACCRGGS